MKLGTAKITETNGTVIVRYVGIGSFLVGEQIFGASRHGWNAALRFCRERDLEVGA